MKRTFVLVCLMIILSSCTSQTEDVYEEGIVTVLPHVELITGLIAVAEGESYRGLIGNGNVYYRELYDFMEHYKEHNAFKIYEDLSADGFKYETPYAFVLHHNSIEGLSEDIQYNDFIVSRGYDIDSLHAFAEELYDLAQESNFYEDFYLEHLELYNSLESDVSQSMKWEDVYNFIERIYGESSVQCHTILAPATLSPGGYSVYIQNNEESNFYNILRSNGNEHDRVVFESDFVTPITVHEWSHVYVNPAVYDKMMELLDEDRIDNLVKLYEPVDEIMMTSGYTSVELFVDEQIIRGITLYFYDEYLSEEEFKEELLRQEAAGFYLTKYTYNEVKEYMTAEKKGTHIDLIGFLIEGYMSQ